MEKTKEDWAKWLNHKSNKERWIEEQEQEQEQEQEREREQEDN